MIFPRLPKTYRKFIYNWTRIVLEHPRIIILIPSLLVFIFGYNVAYDFSVKKVNSCLASAVSDDARMLVAGAPSRSNLAHTVDRLVELVHGDKNNSLVLSKVVLSASRRGADNVLDNVVDNVVDNVLSLDFFAELRALENELLSQYASDTVIISPIDDGPINRIEFGSLHNIDAFRHYLIEYFNFGLNNLLTFLYVDKIVKSNHLIKYARNINIYIVHTKRLEPSAALPAMLAALGSTVEVEKVVSSASAPTIADFVHYYLLHNNQSYAANLVIHSTTVLLWIFTAAYLVYTYIAITNEHKIRSSFGLLLGWVVSIFISCAAAINLVVSAHGYKTWRMALEPCTTFIKLAFVVTVMLLSSPNLFKLIRVLGSHEETGIKDRSKRLYWLYVGCKGGLPCTSRYTVLNSALVVAVYVMNYIYTHDSHHYMQRRATIVFQAVLGAMFIQYWLELTFLVGIITIDLKRIDYTKYLDLTTTAPPHEPHDVSEAEGVNVFSVWLLNLKSPFHTKPSRHSLPYKLGQLFLRVRHTTHRRELVAVAVLFTTACLHWSLVIPTASECRQLIDLDNLTIISNTNNSIYYFEMLSIMFFIVTTSCVVFKLTDSSATPPHPGLSMTSLESLLESGLEYETKHFRVLDLKPVHSLDIIQISTNSNSSFIVSVGLDHKVLVWSPLTSPVPAPINIATTTSSGREFWPINHVSISNGGSYIVMVNLKHRVVKCYDRKCLNYVWESTFPDEICDLINKNRFRILESFFRKRTVLGFLARKIMQKRKGLGLRRDSNASLRSTTSSMNGNFPPLEGVPEDLASDSDDYIMVLESGHMLVFSCTDGSIRVSNILSTVYPDSTEPRLLSVKKVLTPRISDRLVCHVSNFDMIIGAITNNKWKFKLLSIKEGYYNQESLSPLPLSHSNSFVADNDFTSVFNSQPTTLKYSGSIPTIYSNKPIIVPVEFFGLVVRVKNFTAELIDIHRGIVLKKFNVGHFKPSTFKVSHSEPTHCKFCGCASIQSFSIVYEDFDQPTLIIHTFKIDLKRSKSNICLRVERDPREIRCLGFSAVTEHQYWFNNVECWELTDVNMIIGMRKKDSRDDDSPEEYGEQIDTSVSSSVLKIDDLVENSGLVSLRKRGSTPKSQPKYSAMKDIWDGFIITVFDGQELEYQIPKTPGQEHYSITSNSINCIEKYGYKSVIVSTSNFMEILYLGNDKLIEDDIYFSGTNATIWTVLDDEAKNHSSEGENNNPIQPQAFNSELLFINKRRKMTARGNKRNDASRRIYEN